MESKREYSSREDNKRVGAMSGLSLEDSKYSPSPLVGDEGDEGSIISLVEDEDLANTLGNGRATTNIHANVDRDAKSGHKATGTAGAGAVSLDLSGFHSADGKNNGQNNSNSYKNDDFLEPAIQEKDVLVVFDLPDGSQGEKMFKYGHTIELLKSFVEGEYGILMSEQSLFLDDRKLENPFSLMDYPEVKGCEEVFIRVEGHLPQFSKK